MFGKRLKLFKLFGFEVRIDISWSIIALLVIWSLTRGVFPYYYPGLSQSTYLWMGILGAIGLFTSIVFHELCHSLVARRFGLEMEGITLFIFGGVTEMEKEPPSAKAEFFMAIAGPLSSISISFVFYGFYLWSQNGGWPPAVSGILSYLRWINWVLAVFNLLPAFPLDGGRIFRSVLWRLRGNLQWATRISVQIGSAFAFILSFLGILNVIMGAFLSGIWWLLIGMFLYSATQLSYQRLLIRRALEGEHVQDFMESNPVTAPATISIAELVEHYIYKYHFKMFPVVDGERLIGSISTTEVKEIPKNEWNKFTVEKLAKPSSVKNTVSLDADATKALSLMSQTGNSRLMVISDNKLVGIISLKDLLRFLSLKLDLEGDNLENH